MSKLSNMLRMVLILNKRETVKIRELSTMLEVSERQIRRYRDELEFSGIYIESTTGKFGGYNLQNKKDVLSISKTITSQEEDLIELISREDYGDISFMYDAFLSYYQDKDMDYLDSQKMDRLEFFCYLYVHRAKRNKQIIKVLYEYDTKNNKSVEKILHPYITTVKYGQKYLYAYDEYQKKVIRLLLFKFRKWEITGEQFVVNETLYNEAMRHNREFAGVYKNNQEFEVTARIDGVEKQVIERKLGCTVNVTTLSKDFLMFSFKTGNLKETMRRLLLFGKRCKVVGPPELVSLMKVELETMSKLYSDDYYDHEIFVSKVEKHLQAYVLYNYGNIPYKHIISNKVPLDQTLLESNRDLFIEYKDEIGDLHSPRNLKSSQLMTLDYFLQYKNKGIHLLQRKLGIDETFLNITFEKVYEDYTHADVVIELPENNEVLIECKYTEYKFDYIREPKEEHINKFNGRSKQTTTNYSQINKLMKKKKLDMQDFFDNYQLFRNVYNAFKDNKMGYVIVVVPKQNKNVIKQFNQFKDDLLNKYGFIYSDRIKLVFWENLSLNDSEFNGKYLFTNENRIDLDLKNKDERIISNSNQELLIEVLGRNNKKTLELTANLVSSLNDKYDVLDSSIRHFKVYKDYIKMNLYK